MDFIPLTPYQIELIEQAPEGRLFLEGPAGSGKTTVGVQRMLALLRAGVPASQLMVLTPQRTLAAPYYRALRAEGLAPGGQVSLLTAGGLARRMVDLFWPVVAQEAGFARPDLPPAFLTLETALYYMAHLVRPLLDEGLFDSLTIDRNRIYSQIIDNLNKAAMVGFPYTDIGARLKSAWLEDTSKIHVYEDAQRCANLFRDYCLQNNLLDFSLQIEVFNRHLWPLPLCRDYLQQTYCHLIADNLEEDSPVAHDLLYEWLPNFDSALLIVDQQAGYRRFLGADPEGAYQLLDRCDEHHVFPESLVSAQPLQALGGQLGRALEQPEPHEGWPHPMTSDQLQVGFNHPDQRLRFYPDMLDWVAGQVRDLIDCGVPPGQIVLLAPLLPDSLRFALAHRLEARGIPYRSHRPSRSLREEPATQALLTLAALAHPEWTALRDLQGTGRSLRPSNFDVAYALIQSIAGLDLVRAQLLVEAGYRTRDGLPALLPFETFRPETQQRITYGLGQRYEVLRRWLEVYRSGQEEGLVEQATTLLADGSALNELDFFFSRLFGEVLSQPGFGFHANFEAGAISANLIESAQKFRWAVEQRIPAGPTPESDERSLGQEYLRMIQDGVLAAQYIQSWQIPPDDAVLVAPAYTFLLANQPVDHQFWLDVGSNAWAERLYQPLTHPYILARNWQPDRAWTDADEYEHNRDTLYRLVLGLLRRCRRRVHLGWCQMSESGYESRGMLLRALQAALQQSRGYQP